MTNDNTPAPRRDGTADEALKLIGDDPETLLLAIQLLDRMYAARRRNIRLVDSY